ncbi:cytochrome c oxidase assembly protein [Methylocystis suflitae]|uniref:cytochrome c oxidase assembly protein n=1 Tax=Methylocystis suflitae TaxID=2951405 RepID=UPI00210D6D21|nr:cytochrome c oxidase assembly protein [Methylocystis suflitae]MCQ4188647.1 cytochrome c oxidase assembly protein [Methylocystis suflitae]
MKRSSLLAVLVSLCTPAAAHSGAVYNAAEVSSLILLLAFAAIYAFGVTLLWRRVGCIRGVARDRAIMFAAGCAALALLYLPSLRELSAGLFAAHMIEHEWAMLIVAPLLILGKPFAAFAWALPRPLLAAVTGLRQWLQTAWRAATQPLFATFQHALTVWAWHASNLYELALRDPTTHFWQHACLLVSALIFWRAMLLSPQKGLVLFCLFFTVVQSGFLGVLLTLSERLWVPAQSANAGAWELTPIEDQQLAGLIMWVPAGLFYTAAALWAASAWIKRPSRGATHPAYVLHHDVSLTAERKVSHGHRGSRA